MPLPQSIVVDAIKFKGRVWTFNGQGTHHKVILDGGGITYKAFAKIVFFSPHLPSPIPFSLMSRLHCGFAADGSRGQVPAMRRRKHLSIFSAPPAYPGNGARGALSGVGVSHERTEEAFKDRYLIAVSQVSFSKVGAPSPQALDGKGGKPPSPLHSVTELSSPAKRGIFPLPLRH